MSEEDGTLHLYDRTIKEIDRMSDVFIPDMFGVICSEAYRRSRPDIWKRAAVNNLEYFPFNYVLVTSHPEPPPGDGWILVYNEREECCRGVKSSRKNPYGIPLEFRTPDFSVGVGSLAPKIDEIDCNVRALLSLALSDVKNLSVPRVGSSPSSAAHEGKKDLVYIYSVYDVSGILVGEGFRAHWTTVQRWCRNKRIDRIKVEGGFRISQLGLEQMRKFAQRRHR